MNVEDFEIIIKKIKKIESILEKIKKRIVKSKNIAIIGHVNPDGDCIGAQLGLGLALEAIGKTVYNINQGPFDGDYARSFENNFIKDTQSDIDLYIIVDSASDARISYEQDKVDLNKTIVIDHHISNNKYGKINWIDDAYLSTCEMIFLLLFFLRIDINEIISQHLLNGVLSDNGYFQHIRKDKFFSLYIAYLLIKYGGDPNFSRNLMFCNNTLQTEKMFALALGRLESRADGKILCSYIYDKEKNEIGDFHSGMFFRETTSIKGVKISVFFKIDEEKGMINISFRSTDDIDVSKAANFFGGGGHKVAAGAHIRGEFSEVKEKTLKLLEDLLRDPDSISS
ncbi:MAG: bifunctional oligoribonuclease/PAP phosphatase NrnA [Spirochaetes bacterium]|nr:bifunctional oligoribonuclease/PAP phosphatase NrnA [Spirochaetota bacterium]